MRKTFQFGILCNYKDFYRSLDLLAHIGQGTGALLAGIAADMLVHILLRNVLQNILSEKNSAVLLVRHGRHVSVAPSIKGPSTSAIALLLE